VYNNPKWETQIGNSPGEIVMARGTVKWFNNAKGYGFIIPDEGGDDLFVHYSYVNMEGYRTLKAGQRVEYDTQEAPKGLHAVNIRTESAKTDAAEETATELAIDAQDGQDGQNTTLPAAKPVEHA
jgi:CspA family cold shock protein